MVYDDCHQRSLTNHLRSAGKEIRLVHFTLSASPASPLTTSIDPSRPVDLSEACLSTLPILHASSLARHHLELSPCTFL
jgi:hypothetical protein